MASAGRSASPTGAQCEPLGQPVVKTPGSFRSTGSGVSLVKPIKSFPCTHVVLQVLHRLTALMLPPILPLSCGCTASRSSQRKGRMAVTDERVTLFTRGLRIAKHSRRAMEVTSRTHLQRNSRIAFISHVFGFIFLLFFSFKSMKRCGIGNSTLNLGLNL